MKKLIFISLALLVAFTDCKKDSSVVTNDYKYTPPAKYSDGIEASTLASEGIDEDLIAGMMDEINSRSGHAIHNILILRNDRLVFEEYFEGYKLDWESPDLKGEIMQYSRETDHFMASVTKSVTSVIAGVAIQLGYLTDLNKKIVDYFPEYSGIMTGGKADITIENLLTMRSGLAFDESTYLYNDPRSDTYKMIHSDDPIAYVFSKPMTTTPGTHFFYNTGTTNVLAAIIEKESGMGFLDFSNTYLFDPLQTEGGLWLTMGNGLPMASGGIYLRARELAKIGLLFLNHGQWEGKQIISDDWISISQYPHVAATNYIPNTSYGYQWWIKNYTIKGTSHRCFFGAGWGEQYLFIIPDFNMIVEFNSGYYTGTNNISPFDLMENYILRAIH